MDEEKTQVTRLSGGTREPPTELSLHGSHGVFKSSLLNGAYH